MHRTTSAVLAGSLLLALLAAPTVARAQTVARPEAEALFDMARAHLERGETREACEKFEASEALDPAVGTMLFLGDCYERLGRTASAWSVFRQAESLAREAKQEQREHIAHARAAALEGKLVRVQVDVPPESRLPGLAVRVGALEVPAGSWGTPLPVDPGELIVAARADARAPWAAVITVSASDPVRVVRVPLLTVLPEEKPRVTTSVVERPVAVAPPTEGPTGSGDGQRVAGIALGGTGVAGIVVASILGAQAIQRNDDSLDGCRPDDPTKCTTEGVRDRESARDFALGSTVGFAVGGALALSGLVVFLTAPSGDAAPAVAMVRPSFSSDGASIAIGGAW